MVQKNIVCFDSEVLLCLRYKNNHMVESLLNEDLCKATDNWGTLLHYAADHGSTLAIKRLIELGSEIDSLNQDDKTSLMIALKKNRDHIVGTLLDANANIHIVDSKGRNALQMLFYFRHLNHEMLGHFLPRIRSESSTTEEFVERLIRAGCTAYHGVFCRDLEVMKGLLISGVDVNSRGYHNKTALHAAAYLNDLEMVKMLIDKGAIVNLFDDYGNNGLVGAALNGNESILEILLTKGADVNARSSLTGYTALFLVYAFSEKESEEQYSKCAEILLLRGANPQNTIFDRRTIVQIAYEKQHRNSYKTKLLIAHLAMLEMLNTPIIQSLTEAGVDEYRTNYPEFGKYHDICQQTLRMNIFRSINFLDLLSISESKMKPRFRNESFVSKLKQFCSDNNLRDQYPLYFRHLEERMSKSIRTVNLEDTAIKIICMLFKENCYVVAREVVDYLNLHDLEQLHEAFNIQFF